MLYSSVGGRYDFHLHVTLKLEQASQTWVDRTFSHSLAPCFVESICYCFKIQLKSNKSFLYFKIHSIQQITFDTGFVPEYL